MKDVVRAFLAAATIQIANILSGVMVARILLVEGRGELAAAMLWPTVIAALGVLGVHEAVTFHASRRTAAGNTILYSGFLLVAVLSVASSAAAFIAVDIALAGYRAEVVTLARYCIAFIPLNYIGLCLVGLFQGAMRFDDWNVLRVLVHVAYAVLVGLFHLLGWGTLAGMVAAMLLSNVVVIVVAILRGLPHGWLHPARPTLARQLSSFGAKSHAGAVVQSLAERMDQLFISVLVGSAGLGLYVVATTVARLSALPAATLASLVFAKVANATGAEDRTDLFGRHLRATLALVVLAAVAVITFADWIVTAFFGSAFAAAGGLARLLAVAALLSGVKTVLAAGLKGLGHPLAAVRGEAAGLGCAVLALALLLPAYGLVGAAVAAIVAQLAGLVVMAADGRRALRTPWISLLRPKARDWETVAAALSAWRGGRGGGAA